MSPQMGVVTDADLAAAVAAHNALTIVHGTVDDVADQTDIATHAAIRDAHIRSLFQTPQLGQYYHSPVVLDRVSVNTALDAANRLWAMPFPVMRDMTVDRIAIDCTVQVGENFRLGIYSDDGTELAPGALLLDAGEITLAGIGVQAIIINQPLTRGMYWVAIVCDGTPTFREFNTANYGLMGINAANFQLFRSSWFTAHGYAALPDPFGALTTDYRFWGIALRILSLP